ncbi:Hypothetical protein ORPV_1194 [Orpheovirus IHUMI-LCC2]|uniref:Uncharacterized protein n=1 Tax=Orpheovirus IHUMI-LCC2 TaxID=2023057 RepID=A0A2I2L6C2_9VIRU|nr:Hypothetical protein ORPV_1194 [Orpheovirus IHUMI-LCC2]SNW63098.1 Hypothetical protein ORPV_1194 [Orpheovirus IHUMI-LCC2]
MEVNETEIVTLITDKTNINGRILSVSDLDDALRQRTINPTSTLVNLIPNIDTDLDILFLSLCLRYAANPNVYINTLNTPPLHVLTYIYSCLSGVPSRRSFLPTIFSIFVLSGANSDLPSSLSVGSPSLSALYPTLFSPLITTNYMYLLLDKPENINEIEWVSAISLHSNRTILYNLERNNIPVNIDYLLLQSINYLNLQSLTYFLIYGATTDYLAFSTIISNINIYGLITKLRSMALTLIDYGAELDKYQLETIRDLSRRYNRYIGELFYDTLVERYSIPYWRKICDVDRVIYNDYIKRIIKSISNEESICEKLSELSTRDVRSLVEEFRIGQRKEINERTNKLLDSSSFICKMNDDVYSYFAGDIRRYVSNNGDLWCFTPDQDLSGGINPYNGEKLPIDITTSPFETNTIESIISLLFSIPVINNVKTDNSISKFENFLSDNNINITNIRKLSNLQKTTIISKFNINLSLIDYPGFSRIMWAIISQYPQLRPEIILLLKW